MRHQVFILICLTRPIILSIYFHVLLVFLICHCFILDRKSVTELLLDLDKPCKFFLIVVGKWMTIQRLIGFALSYLALHVILSRPESLHDIFIAHFLQIVQGYGNIGKI